MAVRTMGAVRRGTNRSGVLLTPSVDILSACYVPVGCSCHAVFERIRNDRLRISPILGYLIRSESGDSSLAALYPQLYLNTDLSYSLLFLFLLSHIIVTLQKSLRR